MTHFCLQRGTGVPLFPYFASSGSPDPRAMAHFSLQRGTGVPLFPYFASSGSADPRVMAHFSLQRGMAFPVPLCRFERIGRSAGDDAFQLTTGNWRSLFPYFASSGSADPRVMARFSLQRGTDVPLEARGRTTTGNWRSPRSKGENYNGELAFPSEQGGELQRGTGVSLEARGRTTTGNWRSPRSIRPICVRGCISIRGQKPDRRLI